MSKSSFSTGSELDETALGWATGQCSILPRRQKNVLFDLFFTRFGKTSRRAARAVRDFVTCSSPGSNGFMEGVTTASQESPADLPTSQDETPSTTPNIPREKPGRDPWSVRNGVSPPPPGMFSHREFKGVTRLPSHCHWKSTHARVCMSILSSHEYFMKL
jgi:hypothetical protein